MKLFFVVFISALALSAQDPQASPPAKKPVKNATPKAAAARTAPKVVDSSKPMPIPATAVLGADGDYHYTDPQGKKWVYRKTPFGVTRMEDTPELTATRTNTSGVAYMKATEVGDKVLFERKGPFGLWKWEKKRSELDEGEKAALANSQAAGKTSSQQD